MDRSSRCLRASEGAQIAHAQAGLVGDGPGGRRPDSVCPFHDSRGAGAHRVSLGKVVHMPAAPPRKPMLMVCIVLHPRAETTRLDKVGRSSCV